jgi:GTP-binding protein YchF
MKIGLVGFAGSGKTTVFNAITGLDVPVGFGGEVRLGTVKVPDQRIDQLSRIFLPQKTTYADISFCDIPGEHGAEKVGLSPGTLQHIQHQDAICLVLRDFPNPALESDPNPMEDLDAFHTECIFADLITVEKRLDRLRKERADIQEITTFEIIKEALERGHPIRSVSEDKISRVYLRGFNLLTDKILIVALNRDEGRANSSMPAYLKAHLSDLGAAGFLLSASVEAEIAGLDVEDQTIFIRDLGLEEPVLARLIKTTYSLLDLISFFTVGEDEVRAWTITRGTKARAAAGRIHSDLERGFIRAEIIPYDIFMEYGSEQAVKDAGCLQVEGKEYLVADGDIMNVRFNL